MAHTICIVHVGTGLVAERSSDTLTSDLPSDIDAEATRAAIDRSGQLHYVGADACAHVCEAAREAWVREQLPTPFCSPGLRDRTTQGSGFR